MTSARAILRFCNRLRDQAVYCLHLLEAGELTALQIVLHSIPGIEDGDKGLSEVM